MRQRGASIFIYLIFGVLIAIFVININPGQSGQSGCKSPSNTVVDVDGSNVALTAYRVAYSNPFNPGRSRERVYFALDSLIRREILAMAATERGLRVTDDMVDEEIKKGTFFIGGLRIPLRDNIFDIHSDGTRTWNLLKYKRWVAGLDVKTTGSYKSEQTRAMEAALMYELLLGSVRVSREEALAEFLHTRNTVSYDSVTFSPGVYRSAMRLTDADIERYLATHGDEVNARYTADAVTYKGRKPELKVRQIYIATEPAAAPPPDPAPPKPDDAKPDDKKPEDKKPDEKKPEDAKPADAKPADVKPADKKPDDKAAGAPPPRRPTPDEAKAKLTAARDAITSKKQKFVDVAKQLNTNDADKASGGDMGWRTADNAQLGDTALNDAVKALEVGAVSEVLTTVDGAYLFLVEAKREGDLTYDQVKHEIAGDLARDTWSKEAAKRAALEAFASAKAGAGKNLDQLFERDAAPPPRPQQEITPEQLEMIKKQLEKQQRQGSLEDVVYETKDIPASWKAPDETAGGSSTGTGTGSAAGAGSATGSAASSASGSAAPPTGTPAATTPPPPPVLEPSKDVLPSFGDIVKPKVSKQGPHPRRSPLPGLPKEATADLFDVLQAGNLAKRVYEVDGQYVLVQLVEKATPKVEEFEKDADRYTSALQLIRSYSFVEGWIDTKCTELTKDNKIKPAKELVSEVDDKGKPVPQVYMPCMYKTQWLNAMLPYTREDLFQR